jgi:hypothetical protein
MLPYTKKIIPERDECTIISEIFATPIPQDTAPTTFFGLFHGKKQTVPLRPYEIAHTSCYEQEILDNSSTRLMSQELTFMGNSRDFHTQPMLENHPGGMPTLWSCAKSAFTVSHL